MPRAVRLVGSVVRRRTRRERIFFFVCVYSYLVFLDLLEPDRICFVRRYLTDFGLSVLMKNARRKEKGK